LQEEEERRGEGRKEGLAEGGGLLKFYFGYRWTDS
jgi:hypothetical protein